MLIALTNKDGLDWMSACRSQANIGAISQFKCCFTMKWSMWISWMPGMMWRMLGEPQDWAQRCLQVLQDVSEPLHSCSQRESQPTAHWRFSNWLQKDEGSSFPVPPCQWTHLKGPQDPREVVLPWEISFFFFLFWSLAARTLNEFSFCCSCCCFSIIIFKSLWSIKDT